MWFSSPQSYGRAVTNKSVWRMGDSESNVQDLLFQGSEATRPQRSPAAFLSSDWRLGDSKTVNLGSTALQKLVDEHHDFSSSESVNKSDWRLGEKKGVMLGSASLQDVSFNEFQRRRKSPTLVRQRANEILRSYQQNCAIQSLGEIDDARSSPRMPRSSRPGSLCRPKRMPDLSPIGLGSDQLQQSAHARRQLGKSTSWHHLPSSFTESFVASTSPELAQVKWTWNGRFAPPTVTSKDSRSNPHQNWSMSASKRLEGSRRNPEAAKKRNWRYTSGYFFDKCGRTMRHKSLAASI